MPTKIENIWSDIDPGFVEDSQGRLKLVENLAAVKSSIDNILRTNQGERVMLNSFGANLQSYVFESMNSTLIKFLSREIKQMIEVWEPRVRISEVEMVPDVDRGELTLLFKFVIRGQGGIFQHKTTIKG